MPILIDGYNLLWAIQGLGDEFQSFSDIQLCHSLDRYLKQTGEEGQIVFDGTGPPDKSPFESVDVLDVFFVGFSTDADTVIEGKIQANTAPKRLTVVSSDRRLRRAARGRKAVAAKSEEFWRTVQKQLKRKRKLREPDAKRHGLSESETEQWLKLFGLDE